MGGFGPGCRGATARPKPLCCDSIMEISSFPSQLHNLRGPYLHSSGRRLGVTGSYAAPHDCRAVLFFSSVPVRTFLELEVHSPFDFIFMSSGL